MEYIRGSGAPECIFHNKHKTLYNLFSPDPAVSCVGFTSWNVHIMKHFAAFRLGVSHFFFSPWCVYMGQLDFISSIFVRFFSKIIWEAFHWSHVTDVRVGLSVPTVCAFYPDSQTVETLRSACIFMCRLVILSLSKANLGKQCNFWTGFNVHVQPGQWFLPSPFFCETANIWNLHHFVSIFFSQFYLGFSN